SSPSVSIRIGDRQLFRRIKRDHLGAFGRHHHFLFDACGGIAVGGGTISLEREDHAFLYLEGIIEGVEAADDGALVQAEAESVAEEESERFHLADEADLLCLGPA